MPLTLSTLEALEPRIAPANVTAVLTDGLLVVKPTDAAAAMVASVVQTSADGFSVFDDGVLVDTFAEVEAVRVLGSIRADSITLDLLDTAADRFPGNVTLRPGDGPADIVEVLAGQMAGDLRVVLGREDRLSTADGLVVGGTLRMIGAGIDTLAEVAGSFGEVVARGLFELAMSGADVAGDVAVTGRPGAQAIVRVIDGTEVSGGFTFQQTIGFPGPLLFENSTVHGPVRFEVGVGGIAMEAAGSTFGGSFSARGGAEQDNFNFYTSVVAGNVRLDLGGGGNVCRVLGGSRIEGSFTLTDDAAGVTNELRIGNSSIDGMVKLLTTGKRTVLDARNAEMSGGVTVHGGTGFTVFRADDQSVLGGSVVVTAGEGSARCLLDEVGDLVSVRMVGGDGPETLTLQGEGGEFLTVTARFGGGGDHAFIRPANFHRVTLDGGSGTDTYSANPALTGPRVSITNFEVESS